MKFTQWLNEAKEEKFWGYHLIIDIAQCNNEIGHEDEIRVFIKDLVHAIDMKAVGPPVIKYLLKGEPNEGYSAMQLIETSSLTFHFVKPSKTAYCDIFSCKKFDPQDAIKIIHNHFDPKHINYCFIHRDAIKGSKVETNF